MRILLIGGVHYPLGEELAYALVASTPVTSVSVWSLDPIDNAHRLQAAGIEVLDNRSVLTAPSGTRGALKLARAARSLRRLNPDDFDVVSIHFAPPLLGLLARSIRRLAPRVVLSFWGSELTQPGTLQRRIQRRLVRVADAITAARPEMRQQIGQRFGNTAHDKTTLMRIGLRPLDALHPHPPMTANRKKDLGLPDEGPLITVGYNGVPAQRHVDILRQLEQARLPNGTTVVLPLTFGGTAPYHDSVRLAAHNSSLNCIVIDSYMTNNQVATLLHATDVFIQLQQTPVMPGTLLEHLVAGSTVITGEWVDCSLVDDQPIDLIRVSTIREITVQTEEALARRSTPPESGNAVRDELRRRASWETHLPKWLDILEG